MNVDVVSIMSTLLRDLLRQAVELTSGHRYWGIREKEILRVLDAAGKRNEHLANPLNWDPTAGCFVRPRETPLTGEEEVFGKYLTMDYCGHDSTLLLKDFDSIEEMERDILSGAGILNCVL